jgi:energy-converting hydrogenase A subunit M
MSTDTQGDTAELDQLRSAYKSAVERWIIAIKHEEDLASGDHSVAEIDQWEQAHFQEDELRNKVKAAKKDYEDALREKFFDF